MTNNTTHTANSTHHELAHVSSPRSLIVIFVALLGLTAVTVAAAQWNTGRWDVWIAMTIATVKATLVGAYYMHLRYDRPLNLLMLVSALAFMTLFIGLTLIDVV